MANGRFKGGPESKVLDSSCLSDETALHCFIRYFSDILTFLNTVSKTHKNKKINPFSRLAGSSVAIIHE